MSERDIWTLTVFVAAHLPGQTIQHLLKKKISRIGKYCLKWTYYEKCEIPDPHKTLHLEFMNHQIVKFLQISQGAFDLVFFNYSFF